MITRAYQNAKGERQEVTLSPAVWEALTEDQLQEMLGFKEKPPVAPVAARVVAKPKAKGR